MLFPSTQPLLELLKELILLFVGEENFEIYFGLFLDDIFIRFFIALCQKGGRFVPPTHLLLITHKTVDNKSACYTPRNKPVIYQMYSDREVGRK